MVLYLMMGAALSACSTAAIGAFIVLQKKSLVGDAVSHALLPGLCLAFLLQGEKSYGGLLGGCIVTGGIALALIDYLPTCSKIKKETATALVLSTFFGGGVLLLTYIQHVGGANQAGLKDFLLGNVASLMDRDILVFSIGAVIFLITTTVFFRAWQLLTFDPDYAKAIGWPVSFLQFLLQLLTIASIVIGVQTVGVVLMSAVLITPAAAACFWTDRLGVMVVLASVFSVLSNVIGIWISYNAVGVPPGPCIVVALTLVALFSFLFAPRYGLIKRKWLHHCHRKKMKRENVLKLLYEVAKEQKMQVKTTSAAALAKRRNWEVADLEKELHHLQNEGMTCYEPQGWRLTAQGTREGKKVLHRHLLWEMYLRKCVRAQSGHPHEDAELVEHVLTPALEQEIIQLVGAVPEETV